MSTVNDDNAEIEDLITCSVCLSKFDEANRKPKFLACAHTICRSCLSEIQRIEKIRCPLCRKVQIHSENVSYLPNNNYAIVLLRKKENEQQKSVKVSLKDMANETLNNVESLLKFKAELDEIMDRRKTNWSEAIKMSKAIESHLSQVMTSIKSFEKEIEDKLKVNNASLAELTQDCDEANHQYPSLDSTRELLELRSLMANIQPLMCAEDTKETIKEKMSKSLEKSEHQLALISSEYDNLRRLKQVRLDLDRIYDDSDTSSSPIWGTSLKVDWITPPSSPYDSNLLLVAHIISTLSKPSFASAVGDSSSPVTSPAKASMNLPNVLQVNRHPTHFNFIREIGGVTTTDVLESSLSESYPDSPSDAEVGRLREAGVDLGPVPIDYFERSWSRSATRYLGGMTSDEDN